MHILDEELYQAGMAIMSCPTAPFHEGHVRRCVMERLKDLPHVTVNLDVFGNLHARYEHEPEGHEHFRVVAHMDHPGFMVQREGDKAELHFGGGVEEKYFVGKKVVFYGDKHQRALGTAVITGTEFSEETKRVLIDGAIPPQATFAMWDLPKARCTKRLFVSRACDDLAQVATVLALLSRLALTGAKARLDALFTRGEEVGFAGAFAALKGPEPLKNMVTLSLETSKARGFARVEGGPIVRVGDRTSTFDSWTTQWLETAFHDLGTKQPELTHQRLLMGGGTCEASVFWRAGLPTGALCVALNNYHNMGPGTSIRAESISLSDWQGLYDFLYYLATEAKTRQAADEAVAARFLRLEQQGLETLTAIPLSH